MKLSSIITESNDTSNNEKKQVFGDKRIPRVTFKHLLHLAQFREERKLDLLKDEKLTTIMYKLDDMEE